MNKLAIVILAAGCSSRLGQPKQLVLFKGTSLIAHQCRQALDVCEQVYCVLGYEPDKIAQSLEHLPINVMKNKNWQSGLSSSIATAVSQLPDDIDGALLLLVDQWKIVTQDLHNLNEHWLQFPEYIVCAGDENLQGPPVIFPRKYFSQLANLAEGNGAKQVIKKHSKQVKMIAMEHAFIDLDTPEQLEQMRKTLR